MTDLIIHGAKIWTGRLSRPTVQAVAVRGERIEAVGSDAEIRRLAGPRTETIDARGRLVLPGFIDAHVHLLSGGLGLLGGDLRPARDEREFTAILRRHVERTPAGEWITGGRWDHESWPSRRRPARGLIDPFTAGHPVLVSRLDGHMALANTLALKLAGIGPNTPDPPGGQIERDERGEPTGILVDAALELARRVIPPPGEEQLLRAARAAMSHAAALGVTSVHSTVDRTEFLFLRRLHERGELATRVYALPEVSAWRGLKEEGLLPYPGGKTVHRAEAVAAEAAAAAAAEEEEEEEEEERGQDARGTQGRDALATHGRDARDTLRARGVKVFADGSLGAGSALFSEPYCDNPSSCGLAIYPEEELRKIIFEIYAAGLQVALHAIGDKAIRWALDAFERLPWLRQTTTQTTAPIATAPCGKRHRIEHAQMVRPEDRARFAALGVLASIQPSHCIDDLRWVERRMGERTQWAYPYRSLLDGGAAVALGTDWPVETLDPMLPLYAAVTRELPSGGPHGGWHGEERVSIEEAIRGYTLGAAHAEFQEDEKGTIEPGKLADMVILSRDILTIPPREILSTKAEMAILGGRVVHQR